MWRTLYALRWHIAYLVVVAAIATAVTLEFRRVDDENMAFDALAGEPVGMHESVAKHFNGTPLRIDNRSRYWLFLDSCPCSADPYQSRFVLKTLVVTRNSSGGRVLHWALVRESGQCFRRPTPEAIQEVVGWFTSSSRP